MEKHWSHMTERILDLTLEIIYLLTGEDYVVVKKTSGEPFTLTSRSQGVSSLMTSSPHFPTREITSNQKILEVTKKIIELLTGEVRRDVPIKCQDNSMEEYVEGHKKFKMEDQPPLASPDGSRERNPPQRCPRPLEDLPIPHHDQNGNLGYYNVDVKQENRAEDEKYGMMGERCEGPKNVMEAPERRPNDQDIKLGGCNIVIKQEFILDNGEYGVMKGLNERHAMMKTSSVTNPSEGCPRPLYSGDCTQEGLTAPRHDQGKEPIHVQIKEEADEGRVRGDFQSTGEFTMMVAVKQEDSPLDIPEIHPRLQAAERSLDPPNTQRSSSSHFYSSSHVDDKIISRSKFSEEILTLSFDKGEECPYQCFECGKSFISKEHLGWHRKTHTGERSFPCLECGKSFLRKANLLRHLRCHTGERPFSCSQCEKCFKHKANLLKHQTCHTGERPFSCSQCEKCFKHKAHLLRHQVLHTGERPFACSDCEKCFSRKDDLLLHQKTHTGENSFYCVECRKYFTTKASLHKHLKIHTGERTFACSECGKRFIQKENLLRHQRTHTGERPFACSECGKSFTQKRHLLRHQKTHTAVDTAAQMFQSEEHPLLQISEVTHSGAHEGTTYLAFQESTG